MINGVNLDLTTRLNKAMQLWIYMRTKNNKNYDDNGKGEVGLYSIIPSSSLFVRSGILFYSLETRSFFAKYSFLARMHAHANSIGFRSWEEYENFIII